MSSKNINVSRIGARQSAARLCPECGDTPRQVGDPRTDSRGFEYRRRSCECGWSGIEFRALLTPALMAILIDALELEKLENQEREHKELRDIAEGRG